MRCNRFFLGFRQGVLVLEISYPGWDFVPIEGWEAGSVRFGGCCVVYMGTNALASMLIEIIKNVQREAVILTRILARFM